MAECHELGTGSHMRYILNTSDKKLAHAMCQPRQQAARTTCSTSTRNCEVSNTPNLLYEALIAYEYMKQSANQRNCSSSSSLNLISDAKQNTIAYVMSGFSACARVRARRRTDSCDPERINHATTSPLTVLCNTHS